MPKQSLSQQAASKAAGAKECTPPEISEPLQERLAAYFSLLRDGADISPAERYRLEGYLQACLELTPLSAEGLEGAIATELAQLPIQSSAVAAADSESWRLPWQRPPVSVLE